MDIILVAEFHQMSVTETQQQKLDLLFLEPFLNLYYQHHVLHVILHWAYRKA